MRCDHWRELVSARLDGELAGAEEDSLDAHLGHCPSCRAFAASAADLHRMARVRLAEPVPDLTAAILAAAAPPPPPPVPRPASLAHRWARLALAWVALVQLALALPVLLGQDAGPSQHLARHVGSFDVALAVGLLVAAWRPERARPLLPVAAVLAACLAATGLVDLVDGGTTGSVEVLHVLDVIAVGLLWLVAGAPRPRRHLAAAVRPA